MLPGETRGSSSGDSRNKSWNKNTDRELETVPSVKERCGISEVLSGQFIPFVPDSTAVPAMSFQPGFSQFESSQNHIQRQFSYPYSSPVNSASHVLQDSCTYDLFDPNFAPHLNLSLYQIKNPIAPPPFTQQDNNNFIDMRSNRYNDSVFMAPSSEFAPAMIPGFAFSTNFPFPRPDDILETMQSRNLEQRLSPEEIMIVMRKELTKSDVGNIGRIVIPKKDAEANLPPLFEREGIILPMDDLVLPVTWEFKFRFWPNNKSRMYILENTGQFVKTHGLQAGDFLSIHRIPASANYFVKGEKRAQLPE